MYQMPQLVKMCEQKMLEQLTVGNAVQLFLFAFQHQSIAKNLYKPTKRFICQNFEAVTNSRDPHVQKIFIETKNDWPD